MYVLNGPRNNRAALTTLEKAFKTRTMCPLVFQKILLNINDEF